MDDWLTIKAVYYYKRMLWKDRQWKDSYCTFLRTAKKVLISSANDMVEMQSMFTSIAF